VRNIQRSERGKLNTLLCYWGKREDVKERGAPAYLLLFRVFWSFGGKAFERTASMGGVMQDAKVSSDQRLFEHVEAKIIKLTSKIK
jgi:hypothetical protein